MSERHSTQSGTEVYHNNPKCTLGNNIEKGNVASGRGGKRLCSECARLNREGSKSR